MDLTQSLTTDLVPSACPESAQTSIPRVLLSALLVFLITFIVYVNSRVNANPDSEWTVFTAHSLLHEGNFSLNEFEQSKKRVSEYSLTLHGDRIYNYFPIGSTLFALPVVALYEQVPSFFISMVPGFERFQKRAKTPSVLQVRKQLEHFTASVISALFVAILFVWAKMQLPLSFALMVTAVVAFGTSTWSVASQSMWQHAPSMLCLSLSLSFFLAAKRNASYAAYASVPLALSFFVRPTNAITILCFTVYMFYAYRAFFVRYLLFALPFVVAFFWHSYGVYEAFLPPYYAPSRVGEGSSFLEAFAANIMSPARGLLVYSPFFIFSFLAFLNLAKSKLLSPITLTLGMIILLHLLCVSSFPRWWAGHSFGPRLMTDMLPYLSFMLIDYFSLLKDKPLRFLAPRLGFFILLAVFSIGVHYQGAQNWEVHLWNSKPVDVDQHIHRIWDWHDPPFLRR